MQFDPRKYVNTNPEPRQHENLNPQIAKDPHQHRAGKMATAFSNAKDHTFQGGFFEPSK